MKAYFSGLKGFLYEFIHFKIVLQEYIVVSPVRNYCPIDMDEEIKGFTQKLFRFEFYFLVVHFGA